MLWTPVVGGWRGGWYFDGSQPQLVQVEVDGLGRPLESRGQRGSDGRIELQSLGDELLDILQRFPRRA
jgi:hypothetical protein